MNCEEKCTRHDQIVGSNGPPSTEHNQSWHLKNSNEQKNTTIIITSGNKIYTTQTNGQWRAITDEEMAAFDGNSIAAANSIVVRLLEFH